VKRFISFGISILIILSMVLFVIGCKTQTAETTSAQTTAIETTIVETTVAETTVAEKRLTIGIVYLTLEHPYYQAFQKQWQRLAKENNFDLVELDGGLKPETETAAVESLIARKVDGILFCLLTPAPAVTTIQESQKAGIPIAAYAIRPGEGAQCPFVGYDEFPTAKTLGKETAKLFNELFPGKDAKIMTVASRIIVAGIERTAGFTAGFKEVSPNAVEVSSPECGAGCTVEDGTNATQDAIVAHPETNVIFGVNDGVAQGAVAALEMAGRGTIENQLVAGYGGSDVACKYMLEPNNPWKITACIKIKENAELSYQVLMKLIKGEIPMTSTEDFLTGEPIILSKPTLEQCQEFLSENCGIENWKP